jgi:DNA-directed RNA polymerase subunit RPC12/RpoP
MARDSTGCGLPRVRVDVNPETRATMECGECGSTFPRSEARIPAKGTLVCPDCSSRDVRDVTDSS